MGGGHIPTWYQYNATLNQCQQSAFAPIYQVVDGYAAKMGTDDWIREWNAASAKNPYVFVNADNPVDDCRAVIDYLAITRDVCGG